MGLVDVVFITEVAALVFVVDIVLVAVGRDWEMEFVVLEGRYEVGDGGGPGLAERMEGVAADGLRSAVGEKGGGGAGGGE